MSDTSKDISPDGIPENSAAHYDQFYGPLYFEPYAIEVAKRINPTSVSITLEIAAGTGRVTRHIRERLPASAKLIASDIDEEISSRRLVKKRGHQRHHDIKRVTRPKSSQTSNREGSTRKHNDVVHSKVFGEDRAQPVRRLGSSGYVDLNARQCIGKGIDTSETILINSKY